MAALVDTNVLVYRHDDRFPVKQRTANALLRKGLATGQLRIPHQALLEFVSAVTKPSRDRAGLLSRQEALEEVEKLLKEFDVLYPVEAVLRTALQGAAAYGLSWYDAHLWAYAEHYGLSEIFSEDFQHGRLYGSVRAVNPFFKA
ncbi:MAG TPA: PIN domain-containing protein [Thermoanaerobaculia bacterium]|nr:PIN domain-containing protein [Thermoanaerobaculia bacterium]